jgi:hypothetical protein
MNWAWFMMELHKFFDPRPNSSDAEVLYTFGWVAVAAIWVLTMLIVDVGSLLDQLRQSSHSKGTTEMPKASPAFAAGDLFMGMFLRARGSL